MNGRKSLPSSRVLVRERERRAAYLLCTRRAHANDRTKTSRPIKTAKEPFVRASVFYSSTGREEVPA